MKRTIDNRHNYVMYLAIIIIFSIWFNLIFFSFNYKSNLSHKTCCKLTGKDAIVDSTIYDVGGTDLGIIIKHNNRYCFLFGDTFSTSSMTGNWRSNTMAISDDTDPSDGIVINSWISEPDNFFAKELISSLKIDNVEITCIPTTAISLNGNIYVYYMSVKHWSNIGGVWKCNNSSIALSTDNGQTFSKISNVSWDGNSNFILFSAVQPNNDSDEFIYFLSTPSGRFGDCYLSRVAPLEILNKTAYEYYSNKTLINDPIWSKNENEAIPIFNSPVGEMSIMWNEYLKKWTVFYTDCELSSIVLRVADNLYGSWSDPIIIVDADEYPSLYGSYVHPDFVKNKGEIVYFIMSVFFQYNTYVMSVNLNSLF